MINSTNKELNDFPNEKDQEINKSSYSELEQSLKNHDGSHKTDTLMVSNNECKNSNNNNQRVSISKNRLFGLDILRIVACFMVIQIHSAEFYFNGADGRIISKKGAFWAGIYDSLFDSCVPLYVMISGYLLLPMKARMSYFAFLQTRLIRVVVPFIVWCVLYSFYFCFVLKKISVKECFLNIPKIFVNYGIEIGHLWYIYMIIGVYLFAPIISPFLREAKFHEFIYYLCFWAISGLIDYIHLVFPSIWGECKWNNTPMLRSFTGHMGYAVLGCFIKLHLDEDNSNTNHFISDNNKQINNHDNSDPKNKSVNGIVNNENKMNCTELLVNGSCGNKKCDLQNANKSSKKFSQKSILIFGAVLTIVGFSITIFIWEFQLLYMKVTSTTNLELSWMFHSTNIAMETFGIFLLLRKLECNNEIILKIAKDISLMTYGIYLSHIMILDSFHFLLDSKNERPEIFIPVLAILTFIVTYFLIKIVSFIPFSKYLIG